MIYIGYVILPESVKLDTFYNIKGHECYEVKRSMELARCLCPISQTLLIRHSCILTSSGPQWWVSDHTLTSPFNRAASISYLSLKHVFCLSTSSHRCSGYEFLRVRLWSRNTGYDQAYLVRCGVCLRLGSSGLDPVSPEEHLPSLHKSCWGLRRSYGWLLPMTGPHGHMAVLPTRCLSVMYAR